MRRTLEIALVLALGLLAGERSALAQAGLAQAIDPSQALGESDSPADTTAPVESTAHAAPSNPSSRDDGDGLPLPDRSRKLAPLPSEATELAEFKGPKDTESYSPAIQIKGTAAYRQRVRAALDLLKTTKTGAAELAALDALAPGKTTTVQYNPSSQTVAGPAALVDPSAAVTRSGRVDVLKPNAGAGSTVGYNPYLAPRDADGNTCSSGGPEIALGHELIHALHNAQGTNRHAFAYDTATENHEEAATMGIGAYRNDPLTENALRRDLGVAPRTDHAGECAIPNANP